MNRASLSIALLLAVPATAQTRAPLDLPGAGVQGGLLHGHLNNGATDLTLNGKPVAVATDGSFLIGFGRDAGDAELSWNEGGVPQQRTIPVAARQWRIEALPTLPPHPVPDAEFEARRPAEIAQINAARADISDLPGWRGGPFIAPAQGRLSGFYGSQRILSGIPQAPHAGLDIAATAGATVVAPAAGVVRLAAAAPFTLEGNLVMIDHGMGLVSALLHLSRIDVKVGDHVTRGQPIGLVGSTGRATGPHLHWGVTWTDVRIDPALLLDEDKPNG